MKLFLLFHLSVAVLMIFFILSSFSLAVLLENVVDPQNWNRKLSCQHFRHFFCCSSLLFCLLPHPCIVLVSVLSLPGACPLWFPWLCTELSWSSGWPWPAVPAACWRAALALCVGTGIQSELLVLHTSGVLANAQTEGESLRSSSALHSQKWIIPCCSTGKNLDGNFLVFNRLFSHVLLNIGVFFSFICCLISFWGFLFLFIFTLLEWTSPLCLLFLFPRCMDVHFLKSKSHFSDYWTLLIPVWSVCVISLFPILPRSL